MTSIATVSLTLVVAALAAGCAAESQTATATGNEPRATHEYRTGSNIAVREPRPATSEEKARATTPADASRPAEQPAKPTN